MNKYKYALIDGNWVLSRNFFAMGGRNGSKVPDGFAERLVASFTSSILGMTNGFLVDKIIILWDTPPYIKQGLLSNTYKENRYYMTEEKAMEIEDPEERENALIDAYNFMQRSAAKIILKGLGCLGLPSIFKQGYEADDLVYLLCKRCSERLERVVIISIDSDWGFWLSPGCDWYNPKSDKITTYDEIVREMTVPEGMSLFRFKSLYDSFYGSHNDLYQTILPELAQEDCHVAFKMFDDLGYSDKLFDNKDLAHAQIESFNFENYPEARYIDIIAESMGVIGTAPSLSKVAELSNQLLVNFNSDGFAHYYSTLNPKLFKE